MTTRTFFTQALNLPIEALNDLDLDYCLVDQNLDVQERSHRVARVAGNFHLKEQPLPLSQLLKRFGMAADVVETMQDATRHALDGHFMIVGKDYPLWNLTPTRHVWHMVAAPSIHAANTPNGAVLLFLTKTEADRMRQRYERILDSTPDGIMIIDPDRHVRVFNRACGELLGRDPAEVLKSHCLCGDVVGCRTADGTSLASQLCPALELFQGTRQHDIQEMLCRNANGQDRWVETNYSPIYNESGQVEFVIGIMRDINERKNLEEKLRQTEKLASLGQLTAGIAHEIKNPLGVILSSVELILDDSRPREMQIEAATFIKEEVQRLDERIRAFLQFARPRPAHPEPVVLNGLIRRTVKAFGSACENVEIQLDLQQPETIVHLDPDQFQQIVTNLLLNAVDAAGDPGMVSIKTSITNNQIVLEVQDNGPGVSEELQGKVFDPFFTTKANGTGLGLSIVYQICIAWGGTVKLGRSSLGGARFQVSIPYHAPLD